jgi:MarR family 2-MHQ and catechol resistance regulon transcriptional repressor
MPSEPPALTDQIISQLRSMMSHQRQKWAAQCQAYGLSMTHFQVLVILDGDGPTAMSRLAEQLGVGFSNATSIVGRLEERGVVRRVHDVVDRRIVLAQLTDEGREMLRHIEEIRLAHMRQLVETMTTDEQRIVVRALESMTAAHQRIHPATDDPEHNQSSDQSSDAKEPLHA